jgi:hypothetical protein
MHHQAEVEEGRSALGEQRRALEKRLTREQKAAADDLRREQKAKADLEAQVRGGPSTQPSLPFPSRVAAIAPSPTPPSLDDRVLGQVEELATYTEAQRQRREQRAGSIAGRLMSDFLGVHDDSQPPPEIKVKVRHNRHRGRAGKVTPDEWASEKGSDSEESADVLNQIHRRLRDLSPTPNRPPRPAAPPFEA